MSTTHPSTGISLSNLLRMTGRVLAGFLIFDVVGVVLTLVAEAAAALFVLWESSALLAYVLWFVVGVFCAVFIYPSSADVEPDSHEGRRRGLQLVVITTVIALVLGMLSSLLWSANGTGEAVAPDHRGVTITYLVTVVLAVAAARFVLFREAARAEPGSAATMQLNAGPRPPDEGSASVSHQTRSGRPRSPSMRESSEETAAQLHVYGAADLRPDSQRFEPNEEPLDVAVRSAPRRNDAADFKPAGFWKTLGFLIGVPVLLFLDASFFVLGPFDTFDAWTNGILTTSLIGGVAWGFAAARWQSPRLTLVVVHLPLLIGTIFYAFAVVLGGLLVAFEVPERTTEILAYAGFGIGFLLGGALVVGWSAAPFDRMVSKPLLRS